MLRRLKSPASVFDILKGSSIAGAYSTENGLCINGSEHLH